MFVAGKGSAGEPNGLATAGHGANRDAHVGHFLLVRARQLTPQAKGRARKDALEQGRGACASRPLFCVKRL